MSTEPSVASLAAGYSFGADGADAPLIGRFVYWKTSSSDIASVLSELQTLQSDARRQWPTLEASVWVRDLDPSPHSPTVMEVYLLPSDGSSDSLDVWLNTEVASATAPWRLGTRHVERFRRASGNTPLLQASG
jgi:hypothetical protein